jgi:predicted porin
VYGTSSVVAASATTLPVSDKADGESAFASYNFNSQFSVFGRYDHTKLSKDVAPDLKDDYFNIGAAYKPLKTIDLALVYKNEKVKNGINSISGADANGSYTIGGANGTRDGHFDEVGFYMQWSF